MPVGCGYGINGLHAEAVKIRDQMIVFRPVCFVDRQEGLLLLLASSNPPVSTRIKCRPSTYIEAWSLSLVTPGRLSTRASLDRERRLNSVDLPTLGLPTMTISGIMTFVIIHKQLNDLIPLSAGLS